MSGLEPIPRDLPSSLCDPAAYPGDPSAAAGVQRIQTHISDVFMTADRVYKLRKAVDLGFVRFATRAERNADCLRELELNRRLAADVYLGVAPVFREPSGFRVGAPGEAIAATDREHCVVMRRLPDGRDALSLLEAEGPRLYALLARITLREDVAEDLMQELFLKLNRSRPFR